MCSHHRECNNIFKHNLSNFVTAVNGEFTMTMIFKRCSDIPAVIRINYTNHNMQKLGGKTTAHPQTSIGTFMHLYRNVEEHIDNGSYRDHLCYYVIGRLIAVGIPFILPCCRFMGSLQNQYRNEKYNHKGTSTNKTIEMTRDRPKSVIVPDTVPSTDS